MATRRLFSTSVRLSREFLISKPGVFAKIIDGKAIGAAVRGEVRDEIREFVAAGHRAPCLTFVRVGEDEASKSYVSGKSKAAREAGIKDQTIVKNVDITQEELLDLIDDLNKDDTVDGMLVQLPLPPHIDEKTIVNAVHPTKDVDGFNVLNIGRFSCGTPYLLPATPAGVIEILKRCNFDTFGRHVCMVGRSKNIGFPLLTLLHSDGTGDATVTICHRYTPPEHLPICTKMADFVIVATGIPNLITKDMIKPGAVVIDIGINRIKDKNGKTQLVGDCDFEGISQVARAITPVPGGVGPMTVAMLLENTLKAWKKGLSIK